MKKFCHMMEGQRMILYVWLVVGFVEGSIHCVIITETKHTHFVLAKMGKKNKKKS